MNAAPLFSIEAESSVLGSLLLENASIGVIESSGLVAQDFSDPGHRVIFDTARKMITEGQRADVITIFERLRDDGVSADWASLAYLNSLAQYVPSASNARSHAKIIKERALRRALVAAAQGEGSLADALTSIDSLRTRLADGGDDLPRMDLRAVCEAADDPELDFVIPGLLAGTVGGIVAPGAAGKSMLALMLGASIATGKDLLGFEEEGFSFAGEPGRVLYLTKEDPQPILEMRMRAISKLIGESKAAQLYERMDIVNLLGTSAAVHEASWMSKIARRAAGARLVIFDTLRRFHEWDENDSGEMTRMLTCLERLAVSGPAVLFLHHTSKAGALQGAGMQQSSKGSAVLVDNVRFQAQLNTLTEEESKQLGIDAACRRDFVVYTRTKANYVRGGAGIYYKRGRGGVLEPAHLGRAGVAVTGQPMPGAAPRDSVRRGGVVLAVEADGDF